MAFVEDSDYEAWLRRKREQAANRTAPSVPDTAWQQAAQQIAQPPPPPAPAPDWGIEPTFQSPPATPAFQAPPVVPPAPSQPEWWQNIPERLGQLAGQVRETIDYPFGLMKPGPVNPEMVGPFRTPPAPPINMEELGPGTLPPWDPRRRLSMATMTVPPARPMWGTKQTDYNPLGPAIAQKAIQGMERYGQEIPPQAEVGLGALVRGQVPLASLAIGPAGPLLESARQGVGRFLGESLAGGIEPAWQQARERWTETPEETVPQWVAKRAGELTVPTETVLNFVPGRRVAGVIGTGAKEEARVAGRALRRLPGEETGALQLGRQAAIEDITKSPAMARWQQHIDESSTALIDRAVQRSEKLDRVVPQSIYYSLQGAARDQRKWELYGLLADARVPEARKIEVANELALIKASDATRPLTTYGTRPPEPPHPQREDVSNDLATLQPQTVDQWMEQYYRRDPEARGTLGPEQLRLLEQQAAYETRNAISGTPMGSPPEVATGLVAGATGYDPNATPEENARNMSLRAAAGFTGMAIGRRAVQSPEVRQALGQALRAGERGTVGDASRYLEDIAARHEAIQARLNQIEPQKQHLYARR